MAKHKIKEQSKINIKVQLGPVHLIFTLESWEWLLDFNWYIFLNLKLLLKAALQ